MENISVQDLLQSPIFQCKICGKRLSHPIMDIPNIGNICGRCFKVNTFMDAKENVDIYNILSRFHIKCCYYAQGCTFEGLFAETSVHEDICRYRETICPFHYVNKCSNIQVPSIITHIKAQHPQCVKNYDSNIINIEFSLEHNFEEFYVLTSNDNNYLLRVKLDEANNALLFVIYYCVFNKTSKFVIKHENADLCIKTKECRMMPDFQLLPVLHHNTATKFDLKLLKNCFNKTVPTTIEFINGLLELDNNKLLKYMECPVCNEYMNVHIKQCNQGHSICKTCRQKLQECPLCKSGFGSARNYALESVSSLMYFPCKNNGCKLHVSGNDIEKHELECRYKHYQCPFLIKLNCKWKGLHGQITEHLLEQHSDYTEFHNFVERKITLDYSNHKYDTICIILGENIFKVCVCVNGANKLFLTYGIYGPVNSTSSKFIWETGVYHKNSNKHKFVIEDICSAYMTTNYKLDIEGYGVDDSIYFYHKITPSAI